MIQPITECVAPDPEAPGSYVIFFGYESRISRPTTLRYGTANNFVSPNEANIVGTAPSSFDPGVHQRSLAVSVSDESAVTWFLGTSSAAGARYADVAYDSKATPYCGDLRFRGPFDATQTYAPATSSPRTAPRGSRRPSSGRARPRPCCRGGACSPRAG